MSLKALIPLFAIALVLSACSAARLNPPVDAQIAADRDRVVDDTELVVVTPSPSEARRLIQRARPLGYEVLEQDVLEGLELTMLTLTIPRGQDGASAIRELEALEPGVTAGVNHAYSPQQSSQTSNRTTQSPRTPPSREYASAMLRWPQSGCKAQMRIGVLDAKLVGPARLSVISANFSRNSASERTLHGTYIVALLSSAGLLNSPQIYHADIVSPTPDQGDVASVDSMLRGLNWMIGQDVRLVNVSMTGPYNKILDRAFASAQRSGVVVVAPVGNSGPRHAIRYPAAFRSTIAVTAVDAEQSIYRDAVRGDGMDFSAPGVDIAIQMPARLTYVSGTSFAAPFVTARIAADPNASLFRGSYVARQSLAATALDLGDAGRDPVFGYGLIQAPRRCSE